MLARDRDQIRELLDQPSLPFRAGDVSLHGIDISGRSLASTSSRRLVAAVQVEPRKWHRD